MLKKRRVIVAVLTVAAIVVAGLAGFWWYVADYAACPADPDSSVQLVDIPPGSSLGAVAGKLQRLGIIYRPGLFKFMTRLRGSQGRIKAGEYRLSGAMTPAEILDRLVRGEVALYRVTIPEGYNQYQVAEVVAGAGLSTRESFLAAALDPELMAARGIAADRVEGYLFPETYFFPTGVTPARIITIMTDRFFSVFSDNYRRRAEELGFTVHEIVTLASLIEKETGLPEERALVSSVFHNRLDRGMRLDCDPTVVYGLPDFDGRITRQHLKTASHYNTYLIRGLPYGPIANPGEASLKAALYPEKTDLLYFVASGDGSHRFSTNLADHNRAVRDYRLGR